ncbi:MAG: type II toxin-antitoxin system HicB family antitoxin [Dehalococcoidia bacterium]
MSKRYNVLLSWDNEDQVWVAYVPTLNWLSTFGDTREEALEQAREAALGYLEAADKEGLEVP